VDPVDSALPVAPENPLDPVGDDPGNPIVPVGPTVLHSRLIVLHTSERRGE
jgi:hypothetical protein